MIKVIGKQGVLLTDQEFRCYEFAKKLRRRALVRKIFAVHRILWPELLDSIQWSSSRWRYALQILLLVGFWPLLAIWGLAVYLTGLLMSPLKFIQTGMVPENLRAPGEKTLTGIYNAFIPMLELEQSDYVECINGWVAILFGESVALDKNLSIYLLDVSSERRDIDPRTGAVAEGLRSNLSVAREYLSRDLGHYLSSGRSHQSSAKQSS
ncbi:MAG: hypothetical protein CL693_01620 [Cellvibrionaceae bacterium]|nr:hypothetical protein [Cellvibrionaceae bacterium]